VRDKDSIRRLVREAVRALTLVDRARYGARITANLWTIPEVKSANTILLYASLPSEAPTELIAAEAGARGIRIVYPRCLPADRTMTLHAVGADAAPLEPGPHGIREPDPACPVVEVSGIDVALIPGLAWDRRGVRLGRGAGYYDRLLSTPGWRALRCGLFFAVQEVPSLPVDPWDVPLDVIITEREVVRPR
jgi:5-formyltetrahydrofolate cyclo-ligase